MDPVIICIMLQLWKVNFLVLFCLPQALAIAEPATTGLSKPALLGLNKDNKNSPPRLTASSSKDSTESAMSFSMYRLRLDLAASFKNKDVSGTSP